MAYSYYRSITVDHTKCGAADSTNFPVLVSMTNASLKTVGNGGHVTSASGFDIAFYSDNLQASVLSYELVFYDGTAGTIEMWVKVPTLSHTSDTVIYMFYGNALVTTDQSSTATWNSNYSGVWHFKDGTTLSLTDSTSNGYNGTKTGTVTASTGKIDGGATFDGSTGYVTATGYSHPGVGAQTFSFWVNGVSFANNPIVFSNAGGIAAPYFEILTSGAVACSPAPFNNASVSNQTISTGVWVHLAGVVGNPNPAKLYINGVEATYSTVGGSGNSAIYTGARFGAYQDTSLKFNGSIDEAHIADVGLTVDWILSEYNNQNSPSTFFTVGTETHVGGSSSLFCVCILSGIGSGGAFFQNPLN